MHLPIIEDEFKEPVMLPLESSPITKVAVVLPLSIRYVPAQLKGDGTDEIETVFVMLKTNVVTFPAESATEILALPIVEGAVNVAKVSEASGVKVPLPLTSE